MEKYVLDEWNRYQSDYRRRNPEKVRQFRINAAKNLLEKNGYRVIAPEKQKSSEGGREE